MNNFFIFLFVLIGITLITTSSFQISSNTNSDKSFLNLVTVQYAYAAEDDGGDDGGDDKDDDNDKDDDKDEEKDDDKNEEKDDDKDEEKDDSDEKEEGNEENKESDDNNDSDSNESNEDTSDDSKDEQIAETQKTDVSDTNEGSNLEQTTEPQDVSSISAVPNEERPNTAQETTTPQTISPQQTDISSLPAVTGEEQILNTNTENQESDSYPQIDDVKPQQIADKISGQIIQNGELQDKAAFDLKDILNKELQNNPDGEISKSIELLAEMDQTLKNFNNLPIDQKDRVLAVIDGNGIDFGDDDFAKQAAEWIIAHTEKDEFDASISAIILSGLYHAIFKNAIGFELTNYDEKGDITNIGLIVKVNKSSDGKGSDTKKDNNYKQDIDCDDIGKKDIKVPPGDPGNLDGDGDGIGCESNGDDDNKNYHYTKKIIKYQGNKCTTESGSIPLKGKIPSKYPIMLGDFYPCELKDGRATLNLPNTQNLQLALIHLDKKDGNHEAVVVKPQKIKNIGQNNALFVVKFNDQFQGQDPITGQTKTLKDVNAIALYNKSKKTIDFENGNGLGIFAVLKS